MKLLGGGNFYLRKDDTQDSKSSIIRWLLSKKKYSKNVEDSNIF